MSINTFPKASKHPVLRGYSIVFGLIIEALVIYYFLKGEIFGRYGKITEHNEPILFYSALLMVSTIALYFIFPKLHRRLNNKIKLMYYRLYRKLTS